MDILIERYEKTRWKYEKRSERALLLEEEVFCYA